MKTFTVVPEDNVIIFDGKALFFDFEPHKVFHVLQWYGDRGQIEYDAGARVELLTSEDYDGIILPYVQLWEDENLRLQTEVEQGLLHATELTPEEEKQLRIAEIKSRLLEIDLESVRPLRAKAYGTATPEDDAKLAALEQEAGALRAELAGLNE